MPPLKPIEVEKDEDEVVTNTKARGNRRPGNQNRPRVPRY